jgi:hypothetical protein
MVPTIGLISFSRRTAVIKSPPRQAGAGAFVNSRLYERESAVISS